MEYSDYILKERGLSKTTCKGYRNGMRRFLRWLSENGYPQPDLTALNPLVLRRYVQSLSEGDRLPRAVHSALQPIRSLSAWLVETGKLSEDPSAGLVLPRKGAATRHTLTDANVHALFQACERLPSKRQSALTRALLAVLAYGGLRRAECCDLRLSDFDSEEQSLFVRHGKGDRSRKVFICRTGADAIREWISLREKDCQHDWLFMLDRARRVHFRGIATLMDTIAATAGLKDNPACTPHSFRHWSASNLLKNGASIKLVQIHLGHADTTTTCKYLHASEQELRAAAELTGLRRSEPIQSAPAYAVVSMRQSPQTVTGQRSAAGDPHARQSNPERRVRLLTRR